MSSVPFYRESYSPIKIYVKESRTRKTASISTVLKDNLGSRSDDKSESTGSPVQLLGVWWILYKAHFPYI